MDSQKSQNNTKSKMLNNNVGSYAISTVNFDSWVNQPVVQAAHRTKKTRAVKEVVHQCFEDCANSITDSFWIEKFKNASYGKFAKFFSYADGTLSYRKGAKHQKLELPGNPFEAAHACMEFFRIHGGIFSPTDGQDSLHLQYTKAQNMEQTKLTWEGTNKKLQECLISYYVMKMRGVMNLSNREVEELRQIILIGLSNKFFGKHNITLENNHIHKIGGLLWNPDERSFYIDPNLKPTVTRSYTRNKKGAPAIDPSQKDMIPMFYAKWSKYIENLDKKVGRHNRKSKRATVVRNRGARLNVMSSSDVTSRTDITDITTTDNDDSDYSS